MPMTEAGMRWVGLAPGADGKTVAVIDSNGAVHLFGRVTTASDAGRLCGTLSRDRIDVRVDPHNVVICARVAARPVHGSCAHSRRSDFLPE